jgi:hypothetical protein
MSVLMFKYTQMVASAGEADHMNLLWLQNLAQIHESLLLGFPFHGRRKFDLSSEDLGIFLKIFERVSVLDLSSEDLDLSLEDLKLFSEVFDLLSKIFERLSDLDLSSEALDLSSEDSELFSKGLDLFFEIFERLSDLDPFPEDLELFSKALDISIILKNNRFIFTFGSSLQMQILFCKACGNYKIVSSPTQRDLLNRSVKCMCD